MKDLVDMFFVSLNKFTAAMAIRECTLWMYQLEHGLNDRWVILPGEEKYRERSKKQINREGMMKGYLDLVWGDYSVGIGDAFDGQSAANVFFLVSGKTKDLLLLAGESEGRT